MDMFTSILLYKHLFPNGYLSVVTVWAGLGGVHPILPLTLHHVYTTETELLFVSRRFPLQNRR